MSRRKKIFWQSIELNLNAFISLLPFSRFFKRYSTSMEKFLLHVQSIFICTCQNTCQNKSKWFLYSEIMDKMQNATNVAWLMSFKCWRGCSSDFIHSIIINVCKRIVYNIPVVSFMLKCLQIHNSFIVNFCYGEFPLQIAFKTAFCWPSHILFFLQN